MAKKTKDAGPAKASPRTRASNRFTLSGDFDSAIQRVAAEQVPKIAEASRQQEKIDTLVKKAISATRAVDHGLSVNDYAMAVNAVLRQLIDERVLGGVLPSEERVAAIVRRELKPHVTSDQSQGNAEDTQGRLDEARLQNEKLRSTLAARGGSISSELEPAMKGNHPGPKAVSELKTQSAGVKEMAAALTTALRQSGHKARKATPMSPPPSETDATS